MVLVKNGKFGHVFSFCKISAKNVFEDCKNEKLKKSKNLDFSKGVSPWIC